MKNRRWLWITVPVGVLALILVCGLGVYGLSRWQAARQWRQSPLVLIHSPLPHERSPLGRGLLVHATGRAAQGVDRLELWADGALAATVNAGEAPLSPLVMVSSWEPSVTGSHILTVRAFSAKSESQATVTVEIEANPNSVALGVHRVEEGETAESIAAAHGITPEELASLNPGLDPSSANPGDEMVVPGGERSTVEEDGDTAPAAPASDSDAPSSAPLAPEGSFTLLHFLGVTEDSPSGTQPSSDPLSLRLEALSLETGSTYEGLHCYAGMGTGSPRWIPDVDGDQATDESFEPLGGGQWEIAAHYAGEAAPVILWPGDTPLPFTMSCVAISEGGSQALELGQIDLEVAPEAWDGVTRTVTSTRGAASFTLAYRVAQETAPSRGYPAILDPSMTAPREVRLDAQTRQLTWLYEPRPEEEAIDGFGIYLNGSLMWTEFASRRSTRVPEEWLYPPCGEPYSLTVTAFREGLPNGPESPPSTPPALIMTPVDACQRQVVVTFDRLVTRQLQEDVEDDPGDIGPVYGGFYVNSQSVRFDGRSENWGGNGLYNNSEYPINGPDGLTTSPDWYSTGPGQFTVDLQEGESLTLRYQIKDEDTGWGSHDDLICEGSTTIEFDRTDQPIERSIRSMDTLDPPCEVFYSVNRVGGTASEAGGGLPRPWLDLEGVTVDEDRGLVQIHVQNTGNGSWEERDLEVRLSRPDGTELGRFTWTRESIAPGERRTLMNGGMRVPEFRDACVWLDPDNEVAEMYEDTGVFVHGPRCPALPDLVVTDVAYEPGGGGQLMATVVNEGEGTISDRPLAFRVGSSDGGFDAMTFEFPSVSVAPDEARIFSLMPFDSAVRQAMGAGYRVAVDTAEEISEEDESNNSYDVGPQATLHFAVCDAYVPHYTGIGSSAQLHLSVDVLGRTTARNVVYETWEHTLSASDTASGRQTHAFVGGPPGHGSHGSCQQVAGPVVIFGDESLQVTFSAEFLIGSHGDWDSLGSQTIVNTPQEAWDSSPGYQPYGFCDDAHQVFSVITAPGHGGMLDPPPWVAEIAICREG